MLSEVPPLAWEIGQVLDGDVEIRMKISIKYP